MWAVWEKTFVHVTGSKHYWCLLSAASFPFLWNCIRRCAGGKKTWMTCTKKRTGRSIRSKSIYTTDHTQLTLICSGSDQWNYVINVQITEKVLVVHWPDCPVIIKMSILLSFLTTAETDISVEGCGISGKSCKTYENTAHRSKSMHTITFSKAVQWAIFPDQYWSLYLMFDTPDVAG